MRSAWRTCGLVLVGYSVARAIGRLFEWCKPVPPPPPPPHRREMIAMLEGFMEAAADKPQLKYEFGILVLPQITLDLQRLLDGLKQEESDGDGHSDSR